MRVLLQLSTYANRRYITMFMTYLYLLTFVVLISSHVKLSRDYVLKDRGLKTYLKRSLSEYKELNSDAKDPDVAKDDVDKDSEHEMFANKIQIERERGDPLRDNKQKRVAADDSLKVEKVAEKQVQKKVVEEKVEKKEADVKANAKPAAPVKKVNKNSLDHIKAIDFKSKYPNVEVVKNFEFDTSPEVKEGLFQNITKDGTFLLFSAFLDFIYGQPYIKILAINGNSFLPRFCCEITYTDGNPVITTKGKIWMLPDHHEKT